MRIFIVLLTAFVLSGCSTEDKGKNQPDVADFSGQWVVINYWAKWCKPCLQEIPELNELDHKFDNVSVLGVNYDGAIGEDLAQQISDFSIKFPVLRYDPAKQLGTRRPSVLPTTLILNPQGELTATLVGPQTVHSLAKATHQIVSTPQDIP
ncbi:MAG: thiol-disulfide isomerase/thioredoxin [Halioglobus sp.]|jgi:thiol-disulfide isomerase/thioredoxin